MRLLVVLGVLTLGLAACGSSPAPRGKPLHQIAFGVQGGNIAPWKVVIKRDGAVDRSGSMPATIVGKLSTARRVRVSQLVRQALADGLSNRRCPNTLPDIASRFIDADQRRVTVHGTCEARFERLFKMLSDAVGLRPARR